MPSFAKPAISDPSNPLVGLWKDHPNASPLEDLVTYHRTRAAEILSTILPSKITHLRQLISTESDPSSVLWAGHVDAENNDFKHPRMIQPDHLHLLFADSPDGVERVGRLSKGDLKKGEGQLLPSEVSRAESSLEKGQGQEDDEYVVQKMRQMNGTGNDTNGGEGSDAVVEKGVRVGPHWFEIVPRNKIQTECVAMTVTEHEQLHMLVMDLRVWLELEIPLIEDGNSFGAEVQNHLIRELEAAYKKSNAFINGSRQHHTDRIKLIQDWVKFPNVMDYPAAIAASDRFDNFITRSYLRQLLLIHGGLLTKFQRNWEKVINPKGTGSGSGGGMY